jgi:hypothetical protein
MAHRFAACCIAAAALTLSAAAPPAAPTTLDMTAFFTGRTHADNSIKAAFHGAHRLIVDSIGGRNKEGQFIQIDTVQEQGKPVRKRTWAMHALGPDHFTGSLTDAVGPVDVTVSGRTATIRYIMRDGNLTIVQQLQLQPDGTLANHVTAKKFGLTVAHVDGTVRKVD